MIRAAQKYGARCTGITLSENQHALAQERVRAAGLSDLVEIRLQDYRDVQGSFDRLNEGQRVSFEEEQSPKGPRASNVRPE